MEIWCRVKGYEGLYAISSHGVVANSKGQVKSPKIDKDGYYKVWLSKNSKKRPYFIHRLVALHFISNPEGKPVVNHVDGDKQNNDMSNLEWATRSENDLHAFKLGLRTPTCGGTSKRIEQYDLEGNLIRTYKSLSEAARDNGYTIQNISYCINGKTKTAYGYVWKFIGKGVTTSRKA